MLLSNPISGKLIKGATDKKLLKQVVYNFFPNTHKSTRKPKPKPTYTRTLIWC